MAKLCWHRWVDDEAQQIVADLSPDFCGTLQLDTRFCTKCAKRQAFMGENWYTIHPIERNLMDPRDPRNDDEEIEYLRWRASEHAQARADGEPVGEEDDEA